LLKLSEGKSPSGEEWYPTKKSTNHKLKEKTKKKPEDAKK
jgi:hypothetical protein